MPGLFLIAPGTSVVLLGLANAGTAGGSAHPDVIIPLVSGAALLAAFTGYALRKSHPLVEVRLLARRSVGSSSAVLFFSGFSLYGAMLLMPLYYQDVRGTAVLAVILEGAIAAHHGALPEAFRVAFWWSVGYSCLPGLGGDLPGPPAFGAYLQASRSGCSFAGDLTQPESDQHRVRPMTFRTESRIKIASSVREVWAYVCDVGRWPEWAPTVLECRVRGGAPLQPGSRVEQRAKLILGLSRGRSQEVTAVEAPRHVAFAGPLGISAARWGMELEPVDDRQTDAMMWIEVNLAGIMRAVPGRSLQGRIQRVSDGEMVAIKAAVESATRGGAES